MRLALFSYKICWRNRSDGLWLSYAGFPAQLAALSSLFDETRAVLLNRPAGRELGGIPLGGQNVSVLALPEPRSTGLLRKIALLPWLARRWPCLSATVASADVVHALLPGDLGVIGALVARLRGRKLFVRHCGTWGHRGTLADRFLAWWLPRLARSGKAIVFATGAGDRPPAPGGPNLHWIFSTALTAEDIARITPAQAWQPGMAPRLVCVGRLTRGKNFHAVAEALVEIRRQHPEASLEILGDGPARGELEQLARRLGLDDQVVRIRGNVDRDEVLRSLSAAHLFVFPTRVAEGFPKAVVEALACGLPVLAPAVSVIPRLLAEGGGTLLSATDASSVARGVLDLLAAPERLPDMGAAARRTASAYTLERWRDEIGRVLEAAWGPLRSP